jgi:hypothetical protein
VLCSFEVHGWTKYLHACCCLPSTCLQLGWLCICASGISAGSQNHDGVLVIRATASSDDSTPARISKMAADAQVCCSVLKYDEVIAAERQVDHGTAW